MRSIGHEDECVEITYNPTHVTLKQVKIIQSVNKRTSRSIWDVWKVGVAAGSAREGGVSPVRGNN